MFAAPRDQQMYQPPSTMGRDPWAESQMVYRSNTQQPRSVAGNVLPANMAAQNGAQTLQQPRMGARFGQQRFAPQQQQLMTGFDPMQQGFAMADYAAMDPQGMYAAPPQRMAARPAGGMYVAPAAGQQNAFGQPQAASAAWPRSRFPPIAGAAPRDIAQAQVRAQAQTALFGGGMPQNAGGARRADVFAGGPYLQQQPTMGGPIGRPQADLYPQIPQQQPAPIYAQSPMPARMLQAQQPSLSSPSLQLPSVAPKRQVQSHQRSRRLSTSSVPSVTSHHHHKPSATDLYADPVSRISLRSRENEAMRRHQRRLSTPTERRSTLTTIERYRANSNMSALYYGIDFEPYTYRDYRNLKSRDQHMRLPQGLGYSETEDWRIQHEKRTRMHDYAMIVRAQEIAEHQVDQERRQQSQRMTSRQPNATFPVGGSGAQMQIGMSNDFGRAASEYGAYEPMQANAGMMMEMHAPEVADAGWERQPRMVSAAPKNAQKNLQQAQSNYAAQRQANLNPRKPLPGIRSGPNPSAPNPNAARSNANAKKSQPKQVGRDASGGEASESGGNAVRDKAQVLDTIAEAPGSSAGNKEEEKKEKELDER